MRILLCSLAALCFISPARAGMISFSDTQSTSLSTSGGSVISFNSGNSLNFTLPQYDLGFVLQGVEIQYEVLSFSSVFTVKNNNSTETATFTANSGTSQSPPIFPGFAGSGLTNSSSFVLSLGPGESQAFVGGISGPFISAIDPGFFGAYMGSGTFTTNGPAFSQSLGVSNISGLTNPRNLNISAAILATVRGTVTYTFDSQPVPEPSSFVLLLGVGCLVLAGGRWRSKRGQAV